MSNDPKSSTTRFESPASQVEALGFPNDLREQLKALYAQTLPEGQSGGMKVTDLRLTRKWPSGLKTEGEWERREGWVVCKCALSHARFAVPEDEPVPALEAEYRSADGTESVFQEPVHPELAADQPKLAERLVADLGRKIRDHFMDVIGVAAKLEVLSVMEELPQTSKEDSDSGHKQCDHVLIDDIQT